MVVGRVREDLDSHVSAAVWENIDWLMSEDGGRRSLEEIAKRVGWKTETLKKRLGERKDRT